MRLPRRATWCSTRRRSPPWRDPRRTRIVTNRVNVTGTIEVMLAAARNGVRRVVYAGSSSVYGVPESLPCREAFRPAPESPYGVSKLAAEHYVRTLGILHGMETVTLRYFNVFGPGQDPESEYAAVVPRFVTAVLEGRRPTIYGTGEVSRDFTYVDNVVDANIWLPAPRARRGITCNIACGDRHTLLELLDAICSAGRPPGRSHLRAAATGRHRPLTGGHLGGRARARLQGGRAVSGRDRPHGRLVRDRYHRAVTERAPARGGSRRDEGRGISLASVGRSAVILTGATAAVQVLGIVRELFLAAKVGISTDFDALLIGIVLPATISRVLTSGVSTALVPAYIEARASHGTAGAKRLAGTVLAWVAMAGVVVTVLLEVFAPESVAFHRPGLEPRRP